MVASTAAPRHSRNILFGLMAASALIGLLRFDDFPTGGFTDDAHYVVLAESLAGGSGYRLINYPNAPLEKTFPPGWPLLLAPLAALFPSQYGALKVLSLALWLGALPVMYALFARRLERPYAEMLVALVALNPRMIGMSGTLMSEAAYVFLSMLALLLCELAVSRPAVAQRSPLIAAATVAAAAQSVRTVGLAIAVALLVYLVAARRIRQLAVVTVVLLVGLVPQLWLRDGELVSAGYRAQVLSAAPPALLRHGWANLQGYLGGMLTDMLVPVFGPSVTAALDGLHARMLLSLLNALVLLAVGVGIALSLRRPSVSDLYVGFYAGAILAFWNPHVGSVQGRFLIPIVPFLVYYLLRGLAWSGRIAAGGDTRRAGLLVGGVVALAVVPSLLQNVREWRHPIRETITDLSVGTIWVREHAPPDAIVMARNPVPDYLYARRRTVSYPSGTQNIEPYMTANGVSYVIVSPRLQTPRRTALDEFTASRLVPLLAAQPQRFAVVYRSDADNVTVYEVRSSPR